MNGKDYHMSGGESGNEDWEFIREGQEGRWSGLKWSVESLPPT